jgi:outer membrane protein assembly factor BamB
MHLYIGCNGVVAAMDPATGKERWRTELKTGSLIGGNSKADVCILEHEDCVYAGSKGNLFCLDAKTGRIRWRNELQGMGFNDVTLAMAGKSIQYVSSHTHTTS